ncbi:MAG: right-handed parallel beta-helix repeat-containing protein [Promethearchaeota archaeon]
MKLNLKEAFRVILHSFFRFPGLIQIIMVSIGAFIVESIISRLPPHFYEYPYKYAVILIITIVFGGSAVLILIFKDKLRYRTFGGTTTYANTSLLIINFALFCFAILIYLFQNTNYPLYGLRYDIDNWYRAAFITKIANGYLSDFNYLGLSVFYSPLYWEGLGLICKWTRIPSYLVMKDAFLIIFLYAPIILFEIWSRLTDRITGLVISVLTFTLILNFYGIYSPDHFLAYIFLVPYIIYFFDRKLDSGYTKFDLVLAGGLGAFLFLLFFLYYILLPLFLLFKFAGNIKKYLKWNVLKNLIVIFFIQLVCILYFIVPLGKDFLKFGFESHQNLYIQSLPIPPPLNFWFNNINIFKEIIFLMGLIVILFGHRWSEFKPITLLLLAAYLIYFLDWFGILNDFPLMSVRFYDFINYLSLIGFSLILKESNSVFSLETIKLENFIKSLKIDRNTLKKFHNGNILGLFVLIFILNYQSIESFQNCSCYAQALDERPPNSELMIYQNLDYKNKVFLTNHWDGLAYLPIYSFIVYDPHYSHPSALFNKRAEFLYNLSLIKNSTEFYNYLLNKNPFERIDYFFLDDYNKEYYSFTLREEYKFTGTYPYTLLFSKSAFNDPTHFKKIQIRDAEIYQVLYGNQYETSHINHINLSGNDEMDAYFNGNATNGSSWSNAYIIANKTFKSDNLYSLVPSFIQIENSNRFIVIKNCSFTGLGFSYQTSAAIKLINVSNIRIEDCIFSNNANGIVLQNASNISISNSHFYNSTFDGIHLLSANNIDIIGSYFYDNQYSGIELNSGNNLTLRYILSEVKNTKYVLSAGVIVNGPVQNSRIEVSSFYNCKHYALLFYRCNSLSISNILLVGNHIAISGNQISDISFNGITSVNNSNYGLFLNESYNIDISYSNFNRNYIAGIYLLQSSNIKIHFSNFLHNSKYGVYIKLSNNNMVQHCSFIGNQIMDYFISYSSYNNQFHMNYY